MGNNQSEQDFETKHLDQTISIAKELLSSLRLSSQEKQADIISLKQEMREDTTHSIASNLWSTENFHELVELSQYANPIANKISDYEMEANKILLLDRMINSPYFARIDFKFDGEDEFEKIYIGMSSLIDDRTQDMYVYDWRSPIASMFYRFGKDKAFYEAPAGKITGQVNLKRQYEIKNGKLEYFFDADIQIIDEFLRKLLSQNTSSKMKSIVETIQKDQDIIIRDLELDLIMVQGVAGSGKTSVALHRAAYLMYQGLAGKLSSNNIVIISPNTLFEQYISNVLPELGEKNVNSLIFENILQNILQKEDIQTKDQFLECILSPNGEGYKFMLKSSAAFKGSSQFAEILERFIHDLPKTWIEFSDVYYDGKYIASRELLKAKVLKGKKDSHLGLRLKQMEQSILEAVHEQRKTRINKLKDFVVRNTSHAFEVEQIARLISIYESNALLKKIKRFTELNCLDLYRKLFSNKDYFYNLAKGIELPDCIEDIINFTNENLKNDHLKYDDALALAFLQLKVEGFADYKDIKQVVIDEAQDYYPIHFEILNLLFPKSRYTILGDINQTIGKQENLSLYNQIKKIFGREKSALITMDKSFRCTSEILEYSTKFLNQDFEVNGFNRKGEIPTVYTAHSLEALDDMIINEIISCRQEKYQSIGLICKSEKDALILYERLNDKVEIQLIKSEGKVELNGALIVPVYMSKGLEFDAVLICDVDKEHYITKDDKKLLYIACTRALHRLSLFYYGSISPLL